MGLVEYQKPDGGVEEKTTTLDRSGSSIKAMETAGLIRARLNFFLAAIASKASLASVNKGSPGVEEFLIRPSAVTTSTSSEVFIIDYRKFLAEKLLGCSGPITNRNFRANNQRRQL